MINERRIEVFIQVFLLVVGIIASSYLVSEVFRGVGRVSAQELTPGQQHLQDSGVQTQFDNNDDASNAADQFNQDYSNAFIDGTGSSLIGGLISLVTGEQIPAVQQVAGSLVQQHLMDVTGGPKVCPLTVDEEVCQPMQGVDCDEQCDGACIDGILGELPSDNECSLGTCYDSEEGVCQPRTARKTCEDSGGEFFDDPNGNIEQCNRGCCLAGSQASFLTERACERRAEVRGLTLGSEVTFEESSTEIECLASVYSQEEGACVLSSNLELNGCRRTMQQECDSLGGEFFEDALCSNSELDTVCEKQNSTACVDGLDGVYWFDTCGNRENIYEGSSSIKKDESWNSGLIKGEEESCILGDGDNPVRNQASCGNCDRLRGSICGEERSGEELNDDPDGGVVCLDRACIDDSGRRREHGESWCGYQGQIGLSGPDTGALDILRGFIPSNPLIDLVAGDQSVDTPGSAHYRLNCLDGEISVNSCDDYRNYLCVESRTKYADSDREFAQAACRPNRWQECLAYNPDQAEGRIIGMAGKASGKILKAKLEATCGLDPDCFVKDVNVDDAFQFSFCAPRYPPGFDMTNNPGMADQICRQASQTCTVIYVKKLSGWKCEENCNCEEPGFAQQMNQFCTSLGDCGASANYVGAIGSGGYTVGERDNSISGVLSSALPGIVGQVIPQLDVGTITSIAYSEPIPGEYIKSNATVIEGVTGNWLNNIFSDLGIDNLLGGILGGGGSGRTGVPVPKGHGSSAGMDVAKVTGGAGAVVFGTQVVSSATTLFGLTSANLAAVCPACMGFGSFAMGASLGAALTGFLINALGIGPGLSKGFTYGLVAAGGIASGFIGYNLATGGAACADPISCVVLAVVVIVIIVLKLFGVGDIDKRKINFECKPWTPPIIGACETCGEDKMSDGTENFPCNRYACESLGQNCQYDSNMEGPDGGLCLSVSEWDTNAPKIVSLDEGVLTEGFGYKEFSEAGFKIRRNSGNGCLSQFESVSYGFELDEYARCSISSTQKTTFGDMIPLPGGVSIDHGQIFSSLDLDEIGVEIPEERGEARFFLACEDVRGNSNVLAPYIVNVCIDPEDWTPPELNYVGGGVLPYGAEEYELVIYVNEPSEVRWSLEDVPFDLMEGEFECDFENRLLSGYSCVATVPIDADKTDIYIRALDQPDLEGTDKESDRNENQESLHVEVTRSENSLRIVSITPNDEIIIDSVPIKTVDVEVRTAGGVDGSADCTIRVNNGINIQFSSTGGTIHTQSLTSITEGNYGIGVECEDEAGNRAEESASFEYRVEDTVPKVGRVYANGGSLFVVTNEQAECSYKENGCNFAVDEGTMMSSHANGLTHFTEFVEGRKYNIKCKDEFGNEQSGCDIEVSGGAF